MILEKAFAKFIGSYELIEGGQPLFALQTLTGGTVFKFNYESSSEVWNRLEMKVKLERGKKADVRFGLAATKKKLDSNEMYELLAHYHRYSITLTHPPTPPLVLWTETEDNTFSSPTHHPHHQHP
jgi:hypothetical protein